MVDEHVIKTVQNLQNNNFVAFAVFIIKLGRLYGNERNSPGRFPFNLKTGANRAKIALKVFGKSENTNHLTENSVNSKSNEAEITGKEVSKI